MAMTRDQLLAAYKQMLIIRKFEETVRDLYQKGQIRGSFHPCVGQEGTAVGACMVLRKEDYLSCTYRGHGAALAKGLSPRSAMAEMLGKASGCSKGKGGSMHFSDPSVGLLGANAIVAGGIPHAAGAALAAQMTGKDTVALAIFGEGAVNQGVFHETLNLVSIWKLPLILLCENNLYSEMTPSVETTAPVETWKRAEAYGIASQRIDGNDVEEVYEQVRAAVERARNNGGATYLEAMTYRLWGHMLGDPEVYRTKEEVHQAWQNEPILRASQRLQGMGVSNVELLRIDKEAQAIIADALSYAEASPLPLPQDALSDILA